MKRLTAAVGHGRLLGEAGVKLDDAGYRATIGGKDLNLTAVEFQLLKMLADHPGRIYTREQLMDRVWGYRDYAGGRVVDSNVARIRRKLGEDGNEPRFIRTVHGVGYAFQEDA